MYRGFRAIPTPEGTHIAYGERMQSTPLLQRGIAMLAALGTIALAAPGHAHPTSRDRATHTPASQAPAVHSASR